MGIGKPAQSGLMFIMIMLIWLVSQEESKSIQTFANYGAISSIDTPFRNTLNFTGLILRKFYHCTIFHLSPLHILDLSLHKLVITEP